MSTDRISERLGTSALNGSVSPTKTGAAAGETGAQDFGATLRLQVATLKAQSLSTLVSSVSDRTSERRSGDVFMVDLWLARETEQRDTQRCCCLPGFCPAV